MDVGRSISTASTASVLRHIHWQASARIGDRTSMLGCSLLLKLLLDLGRRFLVQFVVVSG